MTIRTIDDLEREMRRVLRGERQRILMLDIDGVLLSGRALLLPGNGHYWAEDRANDRHSIRADALRAVFDPTAVALVNRLCAVAGAKVVIHSNWRKTVGLEETRAKLMEQGIEESHLREVWATPRRGLHRDEKRAEITGWLMENRLTPDPGPRPPIEDREAHARWDDAKYDTGHDVVVIDDEDLGDSFMTRTTAVTVDYQEGMSFAAYRLAMGLWRAEDRAMGVFHVADADWGRVSEAFGGNRRRAVEWLHTPDQWGRTQARMLLGEVDRDAAIAYACRGEDPPSSEDLRRRVWAELDRAVADRDPPLEATEPQDPEVAEEFGIDHRWSIALKARAAQLRWPEAIDHLLATMAADRRKVEQYYPSGFDPSSLRGLDGAEVTVLDLVRVGRPWGLVPGLVPRQRVDMD